MSRQLLVRHPAPRPTESLVGYVLRLSEVNGYNSMWSVYDLAGLKQSEVRSCGFKLEKLAAIVNRSLSELDKIGFSAPPDHPRWARLLGHIVVPTDLNILTPGLCPLCVAEMGFIEAHWHLTLMVGCPVHGCVPPAFCPKCGKRLRLFRRGLLECGCGANLIDCDLQAIPTEDAALLDIVRRKVLGVPANADNPLSFPDDQLLAMSLRSLLAVVRALGKHRLIADGSAGLEDECQIVSAAARVLRDWPRNFIKLLTDTGKKLNPSEKGGVRTQFEAIYRALFKNRAIEPRGQTDFLRVAFLEFAENHWDRGYVDPKLLAQVRRKVQCRFITQSEFAAKAGITTATASRWLRDQKMPSRRVRCGKSDRILVDFDCNTVPRTSPGKTYWGREAAKRMGLSVGVLRALKNAGVFEFNHLLPTKGGYHELDIDAFTESLLVKTTKKGSICGSSSPLINVKAALSGHHDSVAMKVDAIRALLTGALAILGNTDGTVGGLLVDGGKFRAFFLAVHNRVAGDTMPPNDVEKHLHCDASAVPSFVQMGLLAGCKTPTGLRITRESVDAFKEKYVSLASIANTFGSSSRRLMRHCEEIGIELLLVPAMRRRGPQPFIRISDRTKLVETKLNSTITPGDKSQVK